MGPLIRRSSLSLAFLGACTAEASSDPASGEAGDDSTGAPFDASRFIGRYHFESAFLPFGERGDPHGTYALVNFEILPDSRATMFYDDCTFDVPITIDYRWTPSDEGWLSLHPGAGETSLRYWALVGLESLRVRIVEPCRALELEIDGEPDPGFYSVKPGESCRVDRCTTYHIMQVDYCEGEEPPPCP